MLQGESINLRAIDRVDIGLVHRWLDAPELMRWWGYGARSVSQTSVQSSIEGWLDAERQFGHPVAFVIELLSGEPIGMMILSDLQPVDRTLELSCFLERQFRERGFGRDALETLTETVFEQWNYHRVSLRCEAMNERAQEFFMANGFILEGRLREARFLDGNWSDLLLFGRIRDVEETE